MAIARHVSQPIAETMLGDARLIAAAAASVVAALREAKLGARDTHLVLIKGPAGAGAEGISRARQRPLALAWRLASLALRRQRAWRNRDPTRWSARVAVSSAAEFPSFEVVARGHSKAWVGDLRIAHRAMADWVDLPAVVAASGDLGSRARPQLSRNDAKRLVAATGVPTAFVSGGAEHQGPPGVGLAAFVARVPQVRATQLRRNRV